MKPIALKYSFAAAAFLALSFALGSPLRAEEAAPADQAPSEDLFAMDLEDALDMTVTVVSKGRPQQIRRAAGSVTVLDENFIRNSGARDLKELLLLLPMFQYGTDVESGDGIFVRGVANVGRVLFRIDGQEMMENAYRSIQLAARFSSADIERVEIIRGPGSVLYGGAAELAVVDVTTKKANKSDSGKKSDSGLGRFDYGLTKEGTSRLSGSLWQSASGELFGEDAALTISLQAVQAQRGTGDYQDFFGGSYSMDDDSEISDHAINVGASIGDFSLRYIRDWYDWEQRDGLATVIASNIPYGHHQERIELAYRPQFTDTLSGVFQANYSFDNPWHVRKKDTIRELAETDESAPFLYYQKHVMRIATTNAITYQPSENLSAVLGTTIYYDKAGGITYADEDIPHFSVTSKALYGEVTYDADFLTITGGSRYETNTDTDSAFVSRLALSKAEPTWHAKLQAAQSFNAPGYEATSLFYDPSGEQSQIKPEESVVYEAEFGHRLSKHAYLTYTLFDQETKDNFLYYFDPDHGDSYKNLDSVGTRGVEVNARMKNEMGEILLGYVYSRATEENSSYTVTNPDGSVLEGNEYIGVSPHKLVLMGILNLTEQLALTTTVQYIGTKYSITSLDENFAPVPEKLSAVFPWDAHITVRDVGVENLEFRVGVNNILDENIENSFSGNGYHAFMPGLGREGFAHLRMTW